MKQAALRTNLTNIQLKASNFFPSPQQTINQGWVLENGMLKSCYTEPDVTVGLYTAKPGSAINSDQIVANYTPYGFVPGMAGHIYVRARSEQFPEAH